MREQMAVDLCVLVGRRFVNIANKKISALVHVQQVQCAVAELHAMLRVTKSEGPHRLCKEPAQRARLRCGQGLCHEFMLIDSLTK